jgi:hypothetical protein
MELDMGVDKEQQDRKINDLSKEVDFLTEE